MKSPTVSACPPSVRPAAARYAWTVLVAAVLLCCITPTAVQPEEVRIVGKEHLSPARLAEALYAKGVLAGELDLIRQAAALVPDEPVYLYFSPVIPDFSSVPEPDEDASLEELCAALDAMGELSTAATRSHLEHVLEKFPDYLPALYDHATLQASPEDQIIALEKIACLDAHNAKPFYLIAAAHMQSIAQQAMELEQSSMPESDCDAWEMTPEQWKPLVDALRSGNKRGRLFSTPPRLPHSADVRIGPEPGRVPSNLDYENALVQRSFSLVGTPVNALNSRSRMPEGTAFGGSMRQIARQARWQALRDSRSGNKEQALEDLSVVHEFADVYAASEPLTIVSFLTTSAVKGILWVTENPILQVPARPEQLQHIREQRKLWRAQTPLFKQATERNSRLLERLEKEPSLWSEMQQTERQAVLQALANVGLLAHNEAIAR